MFAVDKRNISVDSIRELSEVARRIGIHRECNSFEKMVEDITKDKQWFLVDLVKSLKKVTDEWRGWKHQVFGMARSKPYVAAIHQVKELLLWTEQTYKQSNVKSLKSSESYRKFTTDTLRTFVKTCESLQVLQDHFQQNILVPLKEFYNDASGMKYVNKLQQIQMKWRQLLAPGAINSGYFSTGSAVYLKEAEIYESFHCFYLVLRLIPDLCYKGRRCIQLVRSCLDEESANAYRRERNFLVNVWIPKQREKQRQTVQELRFRNLSKSILKIKKEIVKIDEEEHNCFGRQEDLENRLIKLRSEEDDLSSKLSIYFKEGEECKNRISDLMAEREVFLSNYTELNKQVKATQQQLMPIAKTFNRSIENEDYSKWRQKLTNELELQKRHKQQHKEMVFSIEKYRMHVESIENEKTKLNFDLRKTKNQIAEIEKDFEQTKSSIDTLQKKRRNLQLEFKFAKKI